ncbi:protein phosphatase 2C domain-containing protein, partial [Glaesserella parasuis]|nr:protein phosphatase 2C domain-containing protein [Glaesserella parasuis]MDE3962192.1 protein phosphatase 2C domain-containing protein [Glaesserella parasuis]
MNALDQLQQTKSWLEQTDEKTIDAFATQHATLVQLFAETLLNFRRGIENVKIIMPTEKTTVQKTSPTIQ